MNRAKLISTLQQIKTLAAASLAELGKSAHSPHKRLSGGTKGSASPKSLPAWILRLRDHDFFKDPHTAGEVRGRLKSKYPCEHDRVAMALLRLQRQKQLRKTSKIVGKKKQVAYVW